MAYWHGMRRPPLSLLLPLVLLPLLGFGCKERRSDEAFFAPGGLAFAPPPKREPYVSKKTKEDTAAREVVELRQILANLQRAQSYRSRIRTPASNGNVAAELLFSKRNGLHGILQLADGNRSELFLRNQTIFVRYGSSTWENITGDAEAATIRDQLADTLFVNEDGTSGLLLRDSAKLTSIKDDPAGCKLYALEQTFFQPEKLTQKLEICTKNGYPARIKSVTPQGTVEISYDRFDDAGILAEAPVNE